MQWFSRKNQRQRQRQRWGQSEFVPQEEFRALIAQPFEQQPFEPRSAVVEHVPEPDEEEELEHDQLADQPEWVALPSVVNRTRM